MTVLALVRTTWSTLALNLGVIDDGTCKALTALDSGYPSQILGFIQSHPSQAASLPSNSPQ